MCPHRARISFAERGRRACTGEDSCCREVRLAHRVSERLNPPFRVPPNPARGLRFNNLRWRGEE
jgi:hypothetical protein